MNLEDLFLYILFRLFRIPILCMPCIRHTISIHFPSHFDFLNLCAQVYDAVYDGLSVKHATAKVYGAHAEFITWLK